MVENEKGKASCKHVAANGHDLKQQDKRHEKGHMSREQGIKGNPH